MAFSRNLAVISLYLTSLECVLTIVYIYQIPSDPKNIWLWGLSAGRLVWIFAMFIMGAAFYIAGQHTARREIWTTKAGEWLARQFSHAGNVAHTAIPLFGVFILSGYLYLLTLSGVWGYLQPFIERLAPFFLWSAVVTFQYGFLLVFCSRRLQRQPVGDRSFAWWGNAIWGFGLVAVLCAIAAITGLGFEADVAAWGAAGTPLIFWQVLAVCGVLLSFIWIWVAFPQISAWKWLTAVSFVVIWLAAAGLWLVTPMKPNYYALDPVPPNMEYYPYSDAAVHDVIAQNLLIGEGLGGMGGRVVRRPLYALFLAGIHLLAGQDYIRCVSMQVIVLALFPAVVFLLGSVLHSRLAGFLAALFLIVQERNSMELSGVINVSHSKLLMTDLPSALLIALFCLVAASWFRHGGNGWRMPLCLGGVLGALMLIRPQAAVLGFVPLILLLFSSWGRPRRWLKGALLFGLGVALCILPWLWRNWHLTGELLFDEASEAQIGLIAQRYAIDPQPDVEYIHYKKDETPGQYSRRMTALIVDFATHYPGEVASFVSAHFMHNLVNLAALFPISLNEISLEGAVRQSSFWLYDMETGDIPRLSFPHPWLLGANLALLGLGIGSAWGKGKENTLAGLAPLLTYFAYNASNALARNSGWRFMQPADWIGWFFFAIGLSQLIMICLSLLVREDMARFGLPLASDVSPKASLATPRPLLQALLLSLLILLLGASLPLSEKIFARRYPPLPKEVLLERVQGFSLDTAQQSDLEVMSRLIADEKVIVLWGRALYPRFYKAHQGVEVGAPSMLTMVRDQNRLTFELIGAQDARVVLFSERPPHPFQNGTDVYLVGCYGINAFYPYLVMAADIQHPGQLFFYRQSRLPRSPCN